jgi:sialic acid synthase SpsE
MTVALIAEAGSSPASGGWDFTHWCAAAAEAGATAIKLQMFYASHFPEAEQESKYPLEFPRHRLDEFVERAHAHGLQAGVSVFDADAVMRAGAACDFLKLAAREAANHNLILAAFREAQQRGCPLYRSITTLDELYHLPHITHFWTVPRYPAPLALSCLRVLQAARYFNFHALPWGWSSHTTGTFDCVLAVRLGATVIEKHLSTRPADLEAGHSLTPAQFRRMSFAIRRFERS